MPDEATVSRRDAIKKAAGIGAAAGAVWAAPAVNGMSVVPRFAAAATGDEPIVVSGTADKTLGCFSGALGDDRFYTTLGDDGWWGFMFQGCSTGNTETVALDIGSTPPSDAFRPPTGYRCKMTVSNAGGTFDTGWLDDPINGIADTGGIIFIGTADFPDNGGNTADWQITCEPI